MNKKTLWDRFDLEEAIMAAWGTKDDIKLLYGIHMDSPRGPLDMDQLTNALIGIEYLHELRMQRIWDIFSYFVDENVLEEEHFETIKEALREARLREQAKAVANNVQKSENENGQPEMGCTDGC